MPTDDDLPGTRESIELMTKKFNVYFLMVMALIGAFLGLSGILQLGKKDLDGIPEPALLVALGTITFALFFPWFMAVYYARHFLFTVKQLEHENAKLREEFAAFREDQKMELVDNARPGKGRDG